MSLRTGSRLGSYRLLRDFVAGANCRWTFAESEGREFFIKEFQSPKRPPDALPEPLHTARLARCHVFEDRHRRLLAALGKPDNGSNALLVPVAFFRHGLAYYHVAPRIAPVSLSLAEIARLPARERLTVIRAVTRAVMALHGHRVVHGDLKPSNVLVDRDRDGALAVRLIDFDGAYFAGEPPDPDEMEFDQTYMAPEVLAHVRRLPGRALAPPGLAADLFSLGLLVHAYWTGYPPPPVSGHGYAGEAVLAGERLRLDTADLPPSVERLLRRALSADPANRPSPWDQVTAMGLAPARPASAAERAFEDLLSGPVKAAGFSEVGYNGPLPLPASGVPGVVIRKSRNLERDGS